MASLLDKCHLNKIFGNTSIRNQIWLGFGLVLLVLVIVTASTLGKFIQLSDGISEVAEEIQPVVLTAQNLDTSLQAANKSLGFYLLTKEDGYKSEYSMHLDAANKLTETLQQESFLKSHSQYQSVVDGVKNNLEKLSSYKTQIIELATNDVKNIPAQQLAGEKLNPMAQQLQSMISQMIGVDYDEDNSDGSRDEFRQALYDLRYYNVQIASELRTFLAFRSDVNIKNMDAIINVVESKLALITKSKGLYTFEQSEIVPNFSKIFENYVSALKETIKIHSTDKYRTDIYLVKTEIGPLLATIQKDLGTMVEQLKQMIRETSAGLQQDASSASQQVMVGMVVAVVVGVLIAYFMSRMITFPIRAAVHAMEDLAEGEGDLTRRLDANGKSEVAQMARSFNSFAEKVQMLVKQVAESVNNLSRVVTDVSQIVDQTTVGSQQTRQQTEQVATAITEMTATVQEVASNANLAADSAQQADDNARTGQQVVEATIASINSLAAEIETGANVISKLSQDAESIGSVLDVIKGIAEQTNLLALNAAIEAARAGEQGRGFAVVADEVRTLASRTQESTTEIESMIESLQIQARAAVDAISQGQSKAHDSVGNASNAGKALGEITNSVATITSMNIQIATASEEQSSVAEEINQNVVNISHVADENARASSQLATSSDDLAQLATELQQLVAHFKY